MAPADVPELVTRARKSLLLGGSAVLAAAFVLALISLQLIPEIPLRVVEGSTMLNQAIGVGGSMLAGLLAAIFYLVALRGIEEMRIEGDSVVLPVRSATALIAGAPSRLPTREIDEALLRKNARGTDVVEFRTRTAGKHPQALVFALGWAVDPQAFVTELEKLVSVRREPGWEELWYKWRKGKKTRPA